MNARIGLITLAITSAIAAIPPTVTATDGMFPVADTGQDRCYGADREIACPSSSGALFGQDAQHAGNQPSYRDNGDGTVTDLVTGLMWQQGFAPDKLTYDQALDYVRAVNAQGLAGYRDWRLPTIKQLYSLIDFRGTDPLPMGASTTGLVPFIDTTVFDFAYGDVASGERVIDSQWATSTLYVANENLMFGVNFADGRIKGYGTRLPDGTEKTFYVRLCRGNEDYGVNDFIANGDGTVTDRATGLMWSQADSGQGLTWTEALAWVETMNGESYLGFTDWRLPDAKELESIVDYSRSPDTTGSPAIAAVFATTSIRNEYGEMDFPYFWSSTTHLSAVGRVDRAVYVAFGRGLGYMRGGFVDIHGAGCQRSDPKVGEASDYPSWGHGPQGDIQRVFNFVRLVRDADDGSGGPPQTSVGQVVAD